MKPSGIAIVGMAGRFPGARNTAEFWQNLRNGVESIRSLSDEELLAAGVAPADLDRRDYVKRASVVDDVPMFDAAFFGMSPRDAAIMDPQHRHFLECAWQALEDAAHVPERFNGAIGVFAGSGMNTYLIHNLLANQKLREEAGLFQLKQTGNDKDVLATRVSYQFDLRGPSISVQTACSTSLVAVHLACQSLLNFECDMALAGGVTIEVPHGQGYLYREGEILSRDGHCRPFDAASTGTVFASGAGVVVLRRLEDALADGDNIRAVILGSAINNDGARKAGFLAPSVEGQADVIAEALAFADVRADEISYIETHGTGTLVGDPIEVRALTQAFRRTSQRADFCAIGSLKSNVGHLDAASGVAALIKTVLALEHAEIPPSLHFEQPNPHIEFAGSPFHVNSTLVDWPSSATPRRAGVTSLGIGGTNAHVVLEQAPLQAARPGERNTKPFYLLPVSAKTETALDRACEQIGAHLDAHHEIDLADVAWTMQVGRHAFARRRALVAAATREAGETSAEDVWTQVAAASSTTAPPIVFMFSGQGSQYIGMGRDLYEHEPVFRDALDRCSAILAEPLGLDLRTLLYPDGDALAASAARLDETYVAQPALFALEYSLAQWWISVGIKPAAMLGHSIGEYVAACIAGVFSLEDALAVVAYRGRLMQALPAGAMLAVSIDADQLALSGSLSLAAINRPDQCVVSGPVDEIERLQQDLSLQSIASQRLAVARAFHSAMMEPIVQAFEERLRTIPMQAPRIPFLSNVSGRWINEGEATSAAYWSRQLRNTVQFSACLEALAELTDHVLIEVGPGDTLCGLARHRPGAARNTFQSLPRPLEAESALRRVLLTLGELWALGANVDWAALHTNEVPRRVALPTYPFEHQRFWIDPDYAPATAWAAAPLQEPADHAVDAAEPFLYERVWECDQSQAAPAPGPAEEPCCWLVFQDESGVGDQVATALIASGNEVVTVRAGSSFIRHDDASYSLSPAARPHYDDLFAALRSHDKQPTRILHLWSLCDPQADLDVEAAMARSFMSPLLLVQALTAAGIERADLVLVSNGLQQVGREALHHPARALMYGPARVIPLELPEVRSRSVDVELDGANVRAAAVQILAEVMAKRGSGAAAWRHGERFIGALKPLDLPQVRAGVTADDVVLITGGLRGLGLHIARGLADAFHVRLALVSRHAPQDQDAWEVALSAPGTTSEEKERLRKLIAIRSSASGLLVVQGDVTDLEQMQAAIALTLKIFGKIDVVLHAAGVLDDGPLLAKTAERAARVLAPKVQGTLVLEQALRDVRVRRVVLFSSISSIDPPPGQVDYSAANAFLDAFALSRQGAFTVINWGAWRDAGMASQPGPHHPLLDKRLLDSREAIVHESLFSRARQWVLAEHGLRVEGANGRVPDAAIGVKAILPGTAMMEMAAAAFSRSGFRGALQLDDVVFLAPLMLRRGEELKVRVQLSHAGDSNAKGDSFQFSILSHTAEWTEHARGTVAACRSGVPARVDREAIAARCNLNEIVFDEQHRTRQERHLVFGPRWHSLRRILIGDGEALAEVSLDEAFRPETNDFLMHPALFDVAVGASFYLTEEYAQSSDLFLPFAYKSMRLHRPLPFRFFSHIKKRGEGPGSREVERFDVTLVDDTGSVLAEIEGFAARRIADPAKTLLENAAPGVGRAAVVEKIIEIATPERIDPAAGVRALVRLLAADVPRAVIIVGDPLDVTKPSRVEASVEMPPAAPDAAVAITIEDQLIEWWQQMLGVARVTLDDDFFDLGGHSLIAVRLLAKVRTAYAVDLDFGVLFEAPTVRQLANLIHAARS